MVIFIPNFNRKEKDKLDISGLFDMCYDDNDKFSYWEFLKMIGYCILFFGVMYGFAKLLIWLI